MATEIVSTQNERIKKIKSLLNKKGRDEHGLYVVEGLKMVQEAFCYAPKKIRTLLINRSDTEAYNGTIRQAETLGIEVVAVSANVMEAVSDVKTPQGILAVLVTAADEIPDAAGFVVALDGLQDPSNVGAIIRTADAAGADGIILSETCADIYAPKTLRSAMGSHFHIPVEKADLHKKLTTLKQNGFCLYASHLQGDETYSFGSDEKICIVIGNEGHGLSEETARLCDRKIKIPIYGKAESLNAAVAAGILLYEAAKSRV